jgi:hypothetical protein
LLEYFSSRYRELTEREVRLADSLRKFRIGIVYYGRKISQDFLVNNEDEINKIIEILLKLVERKIKES